MRPEQIEVKRSIIAAMLVMMPRVRTNKVGGPTYSDFAIKRNMKTKRQI